MALSTLEMLATGGPVLLILLALSVATVALIGVKTVQLWRCGAGASSLAEALSAWQAGDGARAAELAGSGTAPAHRMVHAAIMSAQAGTGADALEAEMTRLGNDTVAALAKGISKLDLVAMISPLLGLLGTVLGMIQAFQELELAAGAANAAVLAGGIWQALLTTAAGLIVALPAAIAASLMRTRVDTEAQRIESALGQVLAVARRAS